ncbi:MAG: ABC transporter ATP-binding protein [Halanaeroarchaeum sp.]
MAALTLENLTKVFDDGGDGIVAVDDVSIDIADGEFLVLVGPSGCGKSTTLRTIAGLETPTEGDVYLDGERITDKPPQERDTAMVFQSYALYPHMTVRGNMSFGLEESTSLSDEEIETRVTDTAEMMDIEDLLDRKPGELSGGQQQRVALGRAIVRQPAAFLMDEPLANLDAKLRSQMRTELQRLQEDLGVTTVYVTHDQTEAMTMGDRIAILDGGRLQQIGTPLECYHQPATVFVAGFIGEPSMNTFDVRVNDGTLVGEYFEFALNDAQSSSIGDADEIVFGIRPEDIVVDSDTQATDHTYEVTVDVVEPMGNEYFVHMTFDASAESAETFVGTIGGIRQVEQGQTVTVRFPPEAVHLFDARTGDALHNRSLAVADADEPIR